MKLEIYIRVAHGISCRSWNGLVPVFRQVKRAVPAAWGLGRDRCWTPKPAGSPAPSPPLTSIPTALRLSNTQLGSNFAQEQVSAARNDSPIQQTAQLRICRQEVIAAANHHPIQHTAQTFAREEVIAATNDSQPVLSANLLKPAQEVTLTDLMQLSRVPQAIATEQSIVTEKPPSEHHPEP